ncbi:hypothetical protein Sjap_014304 [Stephania japonica]|uniref:Peptidase A1 domain-containing protein n=1 Tax=Stephania japonica TaxID=461633 RepID=A0AAP0NYI5_9MAGN
MAPPVFFQSFCFLLLITCVHHCVSHGEEVLLRKSNQHTHVMRVSSLLPPSDCSTSTKGQHSSGPGPKKSPSLQILHKRSPCLRPQKAQTQPKTPHPHHFSLEQTLLQDQIRLNYLQNQLSPKSNNLQKQLLKKKTTSSLKSRPGVLYAITSYVVQIGLGTPKSDFTVTFDTGSDLTWVQCEPCVGHCHPQNETLFAPTHSTTYSNITCLTSECDQIFKATGDPARCYSSTCGYGIQYGDGSFSAGFLASETLTVTPTDIFPNFLFGCGQNNDGLFGTTAGLLGLGRGNLSFINQSAKKYNRFFYYCLPILSSSTGYLTFGDNGISGDKNVKFTKMIPDPRGPPFYFLNLTGLSVGGHKLGITPSVFSTGGVIIDSGTVITRLPKSAYAALRSEFRRLMSRYKLGNPLSVLDTCYDFSGQSEISVPKIVLLFGERFDVEVEVDSSGVLISNGTLSQVCLAFAGTRDDGGLNVVGSWQQQKLNVVYDLGKQRVGFGPGVCG